MKQTYYFRKIGGYSFPMEVTINDAQHESNFLAAMKRKRFIRVDKEFYDKDERIKSAFNSMFHTSNKLFKAL